MNTIPPANPAMSNPFRRPGFSLLEVLIAVVVIGLLAAIVATRVADTRERAHISTMQADLRNAAPGLEVAHAQNGTYPSSPEHRWSDGVQLLDYEPEATRWRMVVGHERVDAICTLEGGSGSSGVMECVRERLQVSTSNANPAPGESVTLDAEAGLWSVAHHTPGFSLVSRAHANEPLQVRRLAWDLGDGVEVRGGSELMSISHEYADAGRYEVRLIVTLEDGRVLSGRRSLRVGGDGTDAVLEDAVARFTVTPDPAMVGESVVLDASSSSQGEGSITAYEWDVAGETHAGPVVERVFDAHGEYPVVLTVRGEGGLSGTVGETVWVEAHRPVATFTLTPDVVMAGDTLTLDGSASSQAYGEIHTYEWHVDEDTYTGPVVEHVVGRHGEYEVALTVVGDAGLSHTAEALVEVGAHEPVAEFEMAPNPTRINVDISFDGSASHQPHGAIHAHAWDFGDWGTDEGAAVSRSFSTAGVYEVGLEVAGDGDRTDSLEQTLTVEEAILRASTVETGIAGHACALIDGAAYCWGYNGNGQLGDGTSTSRSRATRVAGGHTFASINLGFWHTCALTPAGQAYCWGRNHRGALGDGTWTHRREPTPVNGGHAFTSITGGGYHSCGIRADGAALCWGHNLHGQLGDGSTVYRRSPVSVASTHSFTSLSTGRFHTCGVVSSGAVHCWGKHNHGRLGSPWQVDVNLPEPISSTETFSRVDLGDRHSCGLTAAGEAVCWGRNNAGQLGDGSNGDRHQPAPVAGSLRFSGLSAGQFHSCGTTSAGDAYCWGSGGAGRLGTGGIDGELTPARVAGEVRVGHISAGSNHTCALGGDGAYCWGGDTNGRLGNAGFTGTMSEPTHVYAPLD